jgi:hypothetical protein
MKKYGILVLGVLGAAGLARANIQIDFSSVNGALINFSGGSQFSFPVSTVPSEPYTGYDFQITNEFGLTNSAIGLYGDATGTYTIGTITVAGATQTAPVTGTGALTITDAASVPKVFSAVLNWVNIESFGTGGTINYSGTVNLTGMTYAGTNADLLTLDHAPGGIVTLTYQFIPGLTLTQLATGGDETSYSGTIMPTTVPEPASFLLFGTLLLGVGRMVRKRS